MIDCPACGHPNIEGSDQCEECQADLFDLGLPETTSEGLAQRLIEDSIMELKPELSLKMFPESTVAEVVQTMIDQQASAAMIVHHDALVGIFTERDVLMKIADRYDEVAHEPIRKFMTASPEVLQASDSIAFGLNRMAVKSVRHIPILQDDKPIALVRTRDVLRFLAGRCPQVDEVLPEPS